MTGETKSCPWCEAEMSTTARVCASCGKSGSPAERAGAIKIAAILAVSLLIVGIWLYQKHQDDEARKRNVAGLLCDYDPSTC